MTKRNLFGYTSFAILTTTMFTIAWMKVGTTDCDGFTWMWYHPLYILAIMVIPFVSGLLAAEKKGE